MKKIAYFQSLFRNVGVVVAVLLVAYLFMAFAASPCQRDSKNFLQTAQVSSINILQGVAFWLKPVAGQAIPCAGYAVFEARNNWLLSLALLLVVGAIAAFISYRFTAVTALVLSLVLAYAYIVFALYAFIHKFCWLDYFTPFASIVLIYVGVLVHKTVRTAASERHLKDLAIRDDLTGLFTRRYCEVKLEYEFQKALPAHRNLSVVMLRLPQQASAEAVVKAASVIRDITRKINVVCRYSEKEFCIILAGAKQEGAAAYAQRIQSVLAPSAMATFGIAHFPSEGILLSSDLIKSAQAALS